MTRLTLNTTETTHTIAEHTHAQARHNTFAATLAGHYHTLFQTPDHAWAASLTTPEALARKMTNGLATGTANKDGDGVKRTCRDLGLAHTYKAIRAYLEGR